MGEASRSEKKKNNSINTNNKLNNSRAKSNETEKMGRNQLSPTIVTTAATKTITTTGDIDFSNGGQQLKQCNSNDNASKSKRKVKSKTLDCENADKNSASVAGVANAGGRITANVCVMQLDDMKLQAEGEDELNSSASMETLSDNVSILVDGEKHWISGVDANTTCSDLVSALLSYLNEKQQQRQLTNTDTERWSDIKQSVYYNPSSGNNSHSEINNNNNNNNNNCDSKISKVHNNNGIRSSANPAVCYNAINQSPTNANEPYSNHNNNHMTTSALEYAIVKQYSDCEEYLDSSTKVFDVLPAKEHQARKQCALLLRRLAVAKMSAWLSSMDKDSGMGSPVGSARSAKFRRRKHKSTSSSSWLAQGNTMHPRLVQHKIQYEEQQQQILTMSLKESAEGEECANARLLKIIMAQDETIHRQLALLKEKERQISKIEEEKHRKRERELGKNYLLETYLNCLEEAEAQPDFAPGVEILIDEPYDKEEAEKQEENCRVYNVNNFKSATIQNEQQQQQQQHILLDENVKLKAKTGKRQHSHELLTHKSAAASRCLAEGDKPNAVDETAIKEMELQIMWWEKVYNINCQLQCEEELLLRLHAKIRKQHAKQSYQNQREVLLQIEALDARLAQQCHHLEQGELELSDFNEQLAVKMHLLDTLNAQLQQNFVATLSATNDNAYDKTLTASESTVYAGNNVSNHNQWPQEIHDEQQTTTTTTTTTTMELKEPQAIGLIMDYNTQIKQQQATLSADQPVVTTTTNNLNEISAYDIDMITIEDSMNLHKKYTAENLIDLQDVIAKPSSIIEATKQQQETMRNDCGNQLNPQQESLLPTVETVVLQRNTDTSVTVTEPQQPQQQLIRTEMGVLDKNLLVPLHAVNGKLLQKQMFGTSKIYNSNALMSMQQNNMKQSSNATTTTTTATTTTTIPSIINYQSNNTHENSKIKCISNNNSNNNINEEFHIANIMSTNAVDLNAVDITQLGTLV